MILDTNALSAWAEGVAAAEKPLSTAERLVVPSIVLGEYLFGIRQSRLRRRYEQWLNEYLVFVEIATVGTATADCYAAIRLELKKKARPIPSNDAWIAALALQHDMPILSNDRHFDEVEKIRRIDF